MIETQHITTPETLEQSAIDRALTIASTSVAELGFDKDFQHHLVGNGITLDTEDPAEYWGAVANFTETYLQNNSELTPLDRDSFALVANLPLALTHSYYLDKYQHQMDRGQIRSAKEVVCTYNGLLRHFVRTYPQQSEALKASLLNATLETMGAESTDFTTHAEQAIHATLKGIKHELGFSCILNSLGVTYRDATVEEDLKGRDVVIEFNGNDIGVDVKASLSEVDQKNRGSNGSPIAHKPNGDLVMFSMLLENDFNGGFEPSKKRVDDIAPAAGALLQKAILQSIAK